MRVVYVNYSDLVGGAALGGYRLHRGLIQAGIDSTLLVAKKVSSDKTVMAAPRFVRLRISVAYLVVSALLVLRFGKGARGRSLSLFTTGIGRVINSLEPDVVQLHFTAKQLMGPRDFMVIRAPVFWKAADIWPVAGTQHYPRAENDQVPLDAIGNSGFSDTVLDRVAIRNKRRVAESKRMTLVVPSRWLTREINGSKGVRYSQVLRIPNGLQPGESLQISKDEARSKWGLPRDCKLLLIGADRGGVNRRKGLDTILEAVGILEQKKNPSDIMRLVVVGTDTLPDARVPPETIFIGAVRNQEAMFEIYRAVDLYIHGAVVDNFPNMVLESIRMGTPVAGFDATGTREIVEDGITGVLARSRDPRDLADQIGSLVFNDSRLREMSERALEAGRSRFSLGRMVESYLNAYRYIVGDSSGEI